MSILKPVAVVVGSYVGLFAIGAGLGATMSHHGTTSPTSPTQPRVAGQPAGTDAVGLTSSDDAYMLRLATTPLVVGRTASLRFAILDATGRVARGFQTLAGARMHVTVVSNDLESYEHVIPQLTRDGSWVASISVPAAGPYAVLVHFARGGREHALGAELSAPGRIGASPPPSVSSRTRDGPDTVTLAPGSLRAGRTVVLRFTISSGGQPVRSLDITAGTRGYLMGVRFGDLTQVYASPIELPPDPPGRLSFAARFPEAGTYRMILQARPDGHLITAQLGVSVARA
jgi:hypothetical protein